MKAIKDMLLWSAKEAVGAFVGAFILILAILLVLGPAFGIAWLIDNHNQYWFIAFVPYFLLLPIISKPLASFYGE